MRRNRAFTLVELLVAIGIIGILIAILLPVVTKVRTSARSVHCASNLRQIGAGLVRYFNDFRQLPARPTPLDLTNPQVFRFGLWQPGPSMAELMEKYVGSRSVLYCPSNTLDRNPENWWPYTSGTIAGTYQYPFWLNDSLWMIPKPDYRRLTSDKVLAADYLGVGVEADQVTVRVVAWNHEKMADDSPIGMNMLFGDGHVEWRPSGNGWQLYGVGIFYIYWFLAK